MTLEEIRKAKAALETDLMDRCNEFKRETGMDVSCITLTHFGFESMGIGPARVVSGLKVELAPI
jgi:hypothetical protein